MELAKHDRERDVAGVSLCECCDLVIVMRICGISVRVKACLSYARCIRA